MLKKLLCSFFVAFCVSVGFWLTDYMKDIFDRADIIVPLISFCTAFLTLCFYNEE